VSIYIIKRALILLHYVKIYIFAYYSRILNRLSINKIVFLLIFFICTVSNGQEIHFSQIANNPVSINPANTGNIDGDWRFYNNFRTQWSAIVPYTSIQVGFDKPFYIYTQKFSYGINAVYDESGSLAMNHYAGYLNLAYHIMMKSSFLHLGVQGGYVMKSVNYDGMLMPIQYSREDGKYNPSFQNFEEGFGENSKYLDFNAGIMYEKMTGKLRPALGYSLFHINKPKIEFAANSGNTLNFRHTFYGDLEMWFSDDFAFTPRYYRTALDKATDQLLGADFLFVVSEKNLVRNIFLGAYARTTFNNNTDAIVIMGGFKVSNIRIEIDYDLNLSNLNKTTNYQGAFEVSLIYLAPSSVFEWFTIPCSRL
jgi:type IX secretion system PorP/SprF family membrane protein